MTEKQWKLGEDLHQTDYILDAITFEHIITALHCGERVLNYDAVERVVKDILDSRMEDFKYLLMNNIDEIIAEAAKGRE